jgi:putative ABC transport system ATP-binding protein
MPPEPPVVEAVDLTRTYVAGGQAVQSLVDVSLDVAAHEVVAVTGPSGSGKSTLLFLIAGLDEPDGGAVRVAGTDWQTLRGAARASFRRRVCAFIPQGMALLPQASAAENVELPLVLDGVDALERTRRVELALARVGLEGEGAKLPDQLSGGQQQRVAIARALVTRPAVVLADEPTASLDSFAAEAVTRLLVDAAREDGAAVVLVTHDPDVAGHAGRIVRLRSGRIDGSEPSGRGNGSAAA